MILEIKGRHNNEEETVLLLKNPKKKNEVMLVAITEDEHEILRNLWSKARQILGIYTFNSISLLNSKEPKIKKVLEKYPTALSLIILNKWN